MHHLGVSEKELLFGKRNAKLASFRRFGIGRFAMATTRKWAEHR
jgi:hypothetical protein